MRCHLTVATILLVSICFSGCRAKVETPVEALQVSWGPDSSFVDSPTSLTVQANNQFACELFNQLFKEQPGRNQFFSPWSIGIVLAMALEGAQGNTALEMGQVLGLPSDLRQEGSRPWKLDDYHSGFATLLRHYAAAQNAKKDQPLRQEIAKLRKELDSLNSRIEGERDFKTARDLEKKAEDLAARINQLQSQLDTFELGLANAIWGEKTYAFNKDFEKSMSRYYGTSALGSADFINQYGDERSKINRWVEVQTKGRIKDLVPELEALQARLVRMILVNAIYFKGQWSDPFKKDRTTNKPFFDAAAGKTDVPLMSRFGEYGYAAFNGDGSHFATPQFVTMDKSGRKISPDEKVYPEGDGFQIAELSYKGGKLAMTVILPRTNTSLTALETKLTAKNLENWLAKIEKRKVDLSLPRFKLTKSHSLVEPLKSMGIKQAFSPQADFKGIAKPANPNDELHIAQVLHRSFLEVNEEGTEAAAATMARFDVKSEALKTEPFYPVFRADHPFLFLIRDIESGAILFMGAVNRAESE